MPKEREGARCTNCMRIFWANEFPRQNPCTPKRPPMHSKYCHICLKHGYNIDKSFFNTLVVQSHRWHEHIAPTYQSHIYNLFFYLHKSSPIQPMTNLSKYISHAIVPTPTLSPQQLEVVKNCQKHKLIQANNFKTNITP